MRSLEYWTGRRMSTHPAGRTDVWLGEWREDELGFRSPQLVSPEVMAKIWEMQNDKEHAFSLKQFTIALSQAMKASGGSFDEMWGKATIAGYLAGACIIAPEVLATVSIGTNVGNTIDLAITASNPAATDEEIASKKNSLVIKGTLDAIAGGLIRITMPSSGGSSEIVDVPIGATLEERAWQVHSLLDKVAQGKRTTAILQARAPDGTIKTFVASSEGTLTPAQRELARQLGMDPIAGQGHAETQLIGHARASGLSPVEMGVSRAVCRQCEMSLLWSQGRLAGDAPSWWRRALTFGSEKVR